MMSEFDKGPQKVGELDVVQSRQVRARQQSRATIMAIALVALCVLFFVITLVKVGIWG
jgi:predicted small integral membrane protein